MDLDFWGKMLGQNFWEAAFLEMCVDVWMVLGLAVGHATLVLHAQNHPVPRAIH